MMIDPEKRLPHIGTYKNLGNRKRYGIIVVRSKKGKYQDMTRLFDMAACRALHMSRPKPPKISIGIEISQPPMDGGLSSIQRSMNIGGEPHKLAYINSEEADLLHNLGGSGRPVNGVPAYDYDDSSGGWGAGDETGSGWDVSESGGTSGQGAQGAQDDPEPDDWWGPGEKGDPDWHGGPDLDYSEEEISIHEPWENPEESWYNKFISGIPKFGLSTAKDIGKKAVTSINPLLGLLAYFGPEIMDLLGIKSREEEIEAAIKEAEKTKDRASWEKVEKLKSDYKTFKEAEAKREDKLAQLDTGLPALKEQMDTIDEASETDEDELSAMEKYLKNKRSIPTDKEEWYDRLPEHLKRIFEEDVYGKDGIPTKLFPDHT